MRRDRRIVSIPDLSAYTPPSGPTPVDSTPPPVQLGPGMPPFSEYRPGATFPPPTAPRPVAQRKSCPERFVTHFDTERDGPTPASYVSDHSRRSGHSSSSLRSPVSPGPPTSTHPHLHPLQFRERSPMNQLPTSLPAPGSQHARRDTQPTSFPPPPPPPPPPPAPPEHIRQRFQKPVPQPKKLQFLPPYVPTENVFLQGYVTGVEAQKIVQSADYQFFSLPSSQKDAGDPRQKSCSDRRVTWQAEPSKEEAEAPEEGELQLFPRGPERVSVDGKAVPVSDLLPNSASYLLISNPAILGRSCRTMGCHDPYLCTYVHFAEVTVAGEKVSLRDLRFNPGLEILLRTRSLSGTWCRETDPAHDRSCCVYVHRRTVKGAIGGDQFPSVELPAPPAPIKTPSNAIFVESTLLEVDEVLCNAALEYLLQNPERQGKFCTATGRHDPFLCHYIHKAYVAVGEDCFHVRDLVDNPAKSYLLLNPSAVGRHCTLSHPHDHSMCTYVHSIPRPASKNDLSRYDSGMSGSESFSPAGISPAVSFGSDGPESYLWTGGPDDLNCPHCHTVLDPRTIRLYGACRTCGVDWHLYGLGHTEPVPRVPPGFVQGFFST